MAKEKRRNIQSDPRRILNGQNPGQVRKTFAPGQAVYAQGDCADAVFFVESGWVKMSVVAPSGKEAVIALRGPCEFFGSRSLTGQPRPASIITLTACSLVRITTPALMRLVREMPGFAEMFTVYLVRQSIHDQETLVDLLTSSAEQRLARTLLRLADAGRGDDPDEDQSGPVCPHDRHHALARQFLHDPVQTAGLHRIRTGWAHPGSAIAAPGDR
jgi:CRP/FNR family transcriptional regulator, cyclic AMP receptor protein